MLYEFLFNSSHISFKIIHNYKIFYIFETVLPDYVYLGNTLESWQCVQGIRGENRQHKSDYYCQDYSLLYAIDRFRGMSHEEAAFDLVSRRDDVVIDLDELLRALAYRIRDEMKQPIPQRFKIGKVINYNVKVITILYHDFGIIIYYYLCYNYNLHWRSIVMQYYHYRRCN